MVLCFHGCDISNLLKVKIRKSNDRLVKMPGLNKLLANSMQFQAYYLHRHLIFKYKDEIGLIVSLLALRVHVQQQVMLNALFF